MNGVVSFIVPALNEAAYIADTIESIHGTMRDAERDQGYEVIVVDDNSADATAEIASRHRARVVSVHKRNIAAVRNIGATYAQGELFIFLDADTRVSPALIRETLDKLTPETMWGTACAIPADSCPMWARAGLIAYNYFYVRWRRCAYGFFFFVRKTSFERVGGFPEQTREGEDMALSKLLLQRVGPPLVLRTRVATSARKIKQFGFRYHMKMLWLTMIYGDEAYSRPEISDYRNGDLRG